MNRLIKQETVDIDGEIVVQYIYTLGMAGERLSVSELDRTVEYSYDSLYRLTSETITEGEKVTVYTYAYDNVSNRILKTENGAATEYVYNALNQLVSDSETTYEYDLNGNLIRVIGTANSALYEYNSENKLVKATVQNGSLVIEESYTYDYEGNRTSKTTHKSNGEFEYVKYLNDNSSLTNVLAEIDENGTAKCVYTIGADLISQERDGRTSFYLYDGHGSVVGLANESGVVTDTYSYDAFGNLLKSTGSTKNCYRYCGEQFDETTGMYYLRARYMDTSAGRFISQDTYQGTINAPVSLHKYLYAAADPINKIDPTGELFEPLFAVAGSMGIEANNSAIYIKLFVELSALLISSMALGCLIYSNLLANTHCTKAIACGTIDSAVINNVSKSQASESSDSKKRRKIPGFIKYGPLDSVGRATEATGLLTEDILLCGTPARHSLKPIGIDTDKKLDRGHLIAKMLGGSGDVIENLTPIYHRVNNGIMKHYEYMIRNAVYINEYVFVEVLPFYAGNNGVPLFIEITAFSFNGAFQLSVPIINVK